jgi:hypothetical protein
MATRLQGLDHAICNSQGAIESLAVGHDIKAAPALQDPIEMTRSPLKDLGGSRDEWVWVGQNIWNAERRRFLGPLLNLRADIGGCLDVCWFLDQSPPDVRRARTWLG